MEKEIESMWNYFLVLEDDMNNTARYVEPLGNETVCSFEFLKILILSCTEIESIFKLICNEIDSTKSAGDIGAYKRAILGKYPKIVDAIVKVKRLGKNIKPFEGWNNGPLKWWDAYQHVKHNRGNYFQEATYMNAVTALSALYVLILYLSEIRNFEIESCFAKYIDSDYSIVWLVTTPPKKLPDFEVSP